MPKFILGKFQIPKMAGLTRLLFYHISFPLSDCMCRAAFLSSSEVQFPRYRPFVLPTLTSRTRALVFSPKKISLRQPEGSISTCGEHLFLDISEVNRQVIYRTRSAGQNISQYIECTREAQIRPKGISGIFILFQF